MANLIRSELFRLSHRLMSRFMLLLMVVIVFAAYIVIWATSGSLSAEELADSKEKLSLREAPDYGMAIGFQMAMLLGVVLASSSIATEYAWGTIRVVLARIDRRADFLTAKLITLALYLFALGGVSLVAVLLGSLIVSVAGDLSLSVESGFAVRALLSAVRVSFAIMPYAALAFLVSLWSRATAAGIATVIVAFYAEVLLSPLFRGGEVLSWFPEDALIYRNMMAVLDLNALQRDGSLPNALQAAGVLAGYVAGFLSLAYWRFQTRDVTLN